jgi:hypothetical protein
MNSLVAGLPALALLPVGYATLCVWMARHRTWWFTYVAYFFIFGSAGGWCLIFAGAEVGGPIAAMAVGLMLLFTLTIAASACLASALILQFRREKSRVERFAIFAGYAFLAINAAFVFKFWT